MLRLIDLAPEPRGFARENSSEYSTLPLESPARSAPGAVNAIYSRAISAATAALAFHRKWLSAREKIIENGSLQLEIRHLAGPPDRALDGLKIQFR